MSPEEIDLEILGLQGEIQTKGSRIHELAQTLYQRVRRAPADDSTAIYITYANAWTRFAGMVSLGAVRTSRVARVLRRLPPKMEHADRPEQARRLVKPQERAAPAEALIAMYDEGESSSAEDEIDTDGT